MNITGIWEGTLDGTNWGRLLAKLTEENGSVTGFAEVTDIGFGTYSLLVTGRRVGEMVGLHLSPSNSSVRAYPGTIDLRLTSETESLIRGEWNSSIKTCGTFRANRQTEPAPSIEVIGKKIAEANAAFIIMAFDDQNPNFLPVPGELLFRKRQGMPQCYILSLHVVHFTGALNSGEAQVKRVAREIGIRREKD